MISRRTRSAFTLIELLIVITIIGILAVALIPKIAGAPSRARDTQRKSDLKAIANALEAYYADYNYYPQQSNACINSMDLAVIINYFNGGIIPKDPSGSDGLTIGTVCANKGEYIYRTYDSYQHYLILANLENDTPSTANNLKYSSTNAGATSPTFPAVAALVSAGDACDKGDTNGDGVIKAGECVFAIGK